VFKPAAISLPVTSPVPVSIMARLNPPGTRIRRASPITCVPPVMPSERIPVAGYPRIRRARTWRQNTNHTRRRWRANYDADLRIQHRCAGQEQPSKHGCREELSHMIVPSLSFSPSTKVRPHGEGRSCVGRSENNLPGDRNFLETGISCIFHHRAVPPASQSK
jgi:hypothetical protein